MPGEGDAPPLRFREPRADEAPALTRIARSAKAAWGYRDEWLGTWEPELAIRPEDLARWRFRVACDPSGELRGFIAWHEGMPRWTIEHLWVAPAAMRQGVGTALLRAAIEAAVAGGAAGLEIDSDPNAMAFYVRLGARHVADLPAPMPGAPDRVLPRLHLDLAMTPREPA